MIRAPSACKNSKRLWKKLVSTTVSRTWNHSSEFMTPMEVDPSIIRNSQASSSGRMEALLRDN